MAWPDDRIPLARVDEIGEEAFLIRALPNGASVGLIRVNDEIRVWLNVCPHAGAPICLGEVDSTSGVSMSIDPGNCKVVVCPWHGWEFDVDTGLSFLEGLGKLVPIPIEVVDSVIYVQQ